MRKNYLKNKRKEGLGGVVKKHKINKLIENFRHKLKRNITHSHPIEFDPYENYSKSNEQGILGFHLPNKIDFILQTLCVLQIFLAFFVYGITLPYNEEVEETILFKTYQILSLVVLVIEMISKTVCRKTIGDKQLETIQEIS